MGFLSVFLTLIKIIFGIIIALILIFLIILGIILFSAIKYEISAQKTEEIRLNIEANWILRIVKFKYRFSNDGKKMLVKVFNKVVYKNSEIFEKNNEWKEEVQEGIFKVEEVEEAVEKTAKNVVRSDEKTNEDLNKEKKSEFKSKNSSQTMQDSVKIENNQNKAESSETEQENTEAIEEKEENIIKRILNLWNYEFRKPIQKLIIKLVKRLLRALLPKHLKLDIEYGSDDPANTGLVLAWSSILILYFGDNIKVKGNFEQKVINGKVYADGKFTLWQIIYAVAACALSKPIRGIIWNYIKNRKKED